MIAFHGHRFHRHRQCNFQRRQWNHRQYLVRIWQSRWIDLHPSDQKEPAHFHCWMASQYPVSIVAIGGIWTGDGDLAVHRHGEEPVAEFGEVLVLLFKHFDLLH